MAEKKETRGRKKLAVTTHDMRVKMTTWTTDEKRMKIRNKLKTLNKTWIEFVKESVKEKLELDI